MSSEAVLQQRIKAQIRLVEQFHWDPTLEPILSAIIPIREKSRGNVNYTDPDFLRRARDPGPLPRAVEGVTWTETTIPSKYDGYSIPVRIYKPESPNFLRPGYVLYHGGGLSIGHLNTEHRRCVELTRCCGAVGISVDYRMAPEHSPEIILEDCYSTLKYVTDHAEEFDVDPRRIAITGGSGGGMATLAVAQMARDRKDTAPLIQISLYPSTDDRKLPEYASRSTEYPVISLESVDAVFKNLQAHGIDKPYIFPNKTQNLADQCPALVIVAQNDPLRDEAIHYAWRLTKAGVATALHVLPGVPHGFDMIAPESDSAKTANFLQQEALTRASAAIPN